MSASVSLAQLPYTGFDYGDMYNNIFWLGLVVWSLMLGGIFVMYRSHIAKSLIRLTRVFMIIPHPREPKIIEEHIVVPEAKVEEETTISKETVYIKQYVDTELAKGHNKHASREFSEDDFSTVDFDGVNPDDLWQPRQEVEGEAREEAKQMPPIKQNDNHTEPWAVPEMPTELEPPASGQHIQEAPKAAAPPVQAQQPKQQQTKDSIKLDTSGEYPQLILTRE